MKFEGTDRKLTLDDLAAMTAEHQLEYVYIYMSSDSGHLSTIEDVYMKIFCPTAVGKTNTSALYISPTIQYEQNKELDANSDGTITKEEASNPVRLRLTQGLLPENAY